EITQEKFIDAFQVLRGGRFSSCSQPLPLNFGKASSRHSVRHAMNHEGVLIAIEHAATIASPIPVALLKALCFGVWRKGEKVTHVDVPKLNGPSYRTQNALSDIALVALRSAIRRRKLRRLAYMHERLVRPRDRNSVLPRHRPNLCEV